MSLPFPSNASRTGRSHMKSISTRKLIIIGMVLLHIVGLPMFLMLYSTKWSLPNYMTAKSPLGLNPLIASNSNRGIILPLFNGIASLGVSLIWELRHKMNINLPIEVPHCGDLNSTWQTILSQDKNIRLYDACHEALPLRKYCESYKKCTQHFRNFEIKVLAMVLSKFDEIMLMDADSLHFHNPMLLWNTPQYIETGTLFFPDRMGSDTDFLARRVKKVEDGHLSQFHVYMSHFDTRKYKDLKIIPRPFVTDEILLNVQPVKLKFKPSWFLLHSHTWNLRSGHEIDSSLLLWNRKRQERATAILSSFIEHNDHYKGRPTSYGDKEFFFIACELAETKYAVSGVGVGAIGVESNIKDNATVLCGDALHFTPIYETNSNLQDKPVTIEPFYINSDNLLKWKPSENPLHRTVARPWSLFPGRVDKYPQECPFNVEIVPMTEKQIAAILSRQQAHEKVLELMNTIQQS